MDIKNAQKNTDPNGRTMNILVLFDLNNIGDFAVRGRQQDIRSG